MAQLHPWIITCVLSSILIFLLFIAFPQQQRAIKTGGEVFLTTFRDSVYGPPSDSPSRSMTASPTASPSPPSGNGAIACAPEKFCVQEINHKVYCFGLADGCPWGQILCSTDESCEKYTKSSPKYTDNHPCTFYATLGNGWPTAACKVKKK
jgi:hypothetical protein